MKAIKNRTYRNFLIIFNQMKSKGYDDDTAWTLTDGIFAEYEMNPLGISIRKRAQMVLSREEYEKECLMPIF